MKLFRLYNLLFFAALCGQLSAQTAARPVQKLISDSSLTESLTTGAKTLTISATGTLTWTSGATLGGSTSAFRTAAGLAIGTDVQAYHASLAAIAAGTWTGAASITTLGAVSTGTWQAGEVEARSGGTTRAMLDIEASAGRLFLSAPNQSYGAFLAATNLTSNRSFELPNNSGTLITTGDTGTVTNTMLAGSIDLTTKVTGALPVANGGTGSTTAAAARVALLPSLSGNNGKVLAVNAGQTDVEWIAGGGGGGLTVGTTTVASGSDGYILYNNAGTLGNLATTGSGSVVRGTSPTLVTPALGTPASGTLTNCTGLPAASLLGGTLGGAAYTISGGTVTASTPLISAAQTWNSAGVTFVGQDTTFTKTAAATGSLMARWTTSSRGSVAFEEGGEVLIGALGSAGVRSGNPPAICGTTGGALHVGCSNGNVYLGAINTFGANLLINGPGNYQKGNSSYQIQWTSDSASYGTADLFLSREAAATKQQGADTNGDAVDQTFKAADGITGTDRSGGDMTIASGRGTGAGAVSAVIISTPTVLGSGTTAQTNTERVRVNSSGLTIGSSGSAITSSLTTTTTWDPANLADGASETKASITLTGVAVGDVVNASLTTLTSASWDVQATVVSANTVDVRITNRTGGAVDLASGTLRVNCIKF